MTPDRYDVTPAGGQRVFLMGEFQKRRGSRMGFSTLGGFGFGGVFVAVGAAITLIGTKILKVDPATVHAPYWVLTMAGVSFAMGGSMVWGMAWKQFAGNRRREGLGHRYPNEAALADYPWHPDGCVVSAWPSLAKALALAFGLTVFLSMFNWWAFGAGGPLVVKAITVLFDLAALTVWWQAARQLGRALKFGRSRIEFASFPVRLPGPVVLRWQPSRGISFINKGTFTLRCVQEWYRAGTKEIWSAQGILEQPRNLPLKDKVELHFEPPAHAQPTQLSADMPTYWELKVKLDLPGLDFNETYLVPVYGPAQTAAAPATV